MANKHPRCISDNVMRLQMPTYDDDDEIVDNNITLIQQLDIDGYGFNYSKHREGLHSTRHKSFPFFFFYFSDDTETSLCRFTDPMRLVIISFCFRPSQTSKNTPPLGSVSEKMLPESITEVKQTLRR